MRVMRYDPEILYVHKLCFFMFLSTFTLLATAIVTWNFDIPSGLKVLAAGLGLSYIVMVLKKDFNPPETKLTAKRMAHTILQDTSPLSIARFASQLYYYFHEPAQAISLLEKYLPSQDPLICTTLGDILLKEGKAKRALYILRDNPFALVDPLLLATQGRVLKHIGKIPEAARLFERSLSLSKREKFPKSSSNWITQKILTISYIANIHHRLADCYIILDDITQAKKHYKAGNRLLLDISLWRRCPPVPIDSTKNRKNTY
ncbi:MAG: tetratricopeptide repeat protein [Desulfosporosinus sp.]|nr:tetratricopeptide repeat protein [Desulfosporosinus sp.]MBC2727666.1 tetratricopeptide repeat protein [Desulfosporosinus sp.]